ncbi:uncharacterized protein [Gossypium hirsutum]|uniref:Uncharacterized protein n=1 Tax=Gossypium hirsutum TaxID=3635 RepID=A0ABM2ZBN7_GOSHI|nr:uncharacterized protein LOC121211385 [Gossypium hirsutum]
MDVDVEYQAEMQAMLRRGSQLWFMMLVTEKTGMPQMAEKLVRKGCEAYLAYISDTKVKSLTVEELITVREFPDVFPKELLGLPPNQEEAHNSLYAMHPGGNKMYRYLHELCWWPGLKHEVKEFAKVLNSNMLDGVGRTKSFGPELLADTEDKVLKFGWKGKLSPRFIGPYRLLRQIGPVAYQLELPPELSQIHDVLHVSILGWYRSDISHVVAVEEIEVRPNLTFEEEPIQIIGRDVKVLRRKSIPLVIVLWQNHKAEEATWEPEEAMRRQYPQLFESAFLVNS